MCMKASAVCPPVCATGLDWITYKPQVANTFFIIR